MNAAKLVFTGAVGKGKHQDRKAIQEARRANWHNLNADAKRALGEKRVDGK